jgi:hypothetical protein
MVTQEELQREHAKYENLEKTHQRFLQTLEERTAVYRDLEGKIISLELRLLRQQTEQGAPDKRQDMLQKKLEEAIQEVVRGKTPQPRKQGRGCLQHGGS